MIGAWLLKVEKLSQYLFYPEESYSSFESQAPIIL